MRALLDFYVLDSATAFMLAVPLAVLLLVMFIRCVPPLKKPVNGAYMAIFTLFYAYGAVVSVNCLMDSSQPQQHSVTIKDKQITKTKNGNKQSHYHYHLQVTPWEVSAPSSIKVSRNFYNQMQIGEKLQLQTRTGLLGVVWFEVLE